MPNKKPESLPEWEMVLASAAHLQQIIPDAVLVGGSASALHAKHRMSVDADHIVRDLRSRFDQILEDLESVAGWKTARVQRPVQILGSLDGIETGVRQLIRTKPLETTIAWRGLEQIAIPTEAEMLRIKAVLILRRNATRDYLDFAALNEKQGDPASVEALKTFDDLYPQPNGESPLQQLIVQLAKPAPYDLEDTDLTEYKHLVRRWQKGESVAEACAKFSTVLLDRLPRRMEPEL